MAHAGMVSVADDLTSWLISSLADAGRKKLTELALGSQQERALRSAATAAVQLTAAELRPGDDDKAGQTPCSYSWPGRQPLPAGAGQ